MTAAHEHAGAYALPGVIGLAGMWLGMMAVMMAPAVWPWIRAFRRFVGADVGAMRGIAATTPFAGGYLAAWLVYAVAAALVQTLLLGAGSFDGAARLTPALGAGILVAAGAFQFTSLKQSCLIHCRNPLSFFLRRWRNGPMGGLRLGASHGMFCVGCCWALMATALAVGMTSVVWMAALSATVFIEQVVPHGDRLRVPLGIVLIAGGLLRL